MKLSKLGRKVVWTVFSAVTIANVAFIANEVAEASERMDANISMEGEALAPNQAELFYMYSGDDGHYFLAPSLEYENVIYVGFEDIYIAEVPHHGTKYIGTFDNADLWELQSLEKAVRE